MKQLPDPTPVLGLFETHLTVHDLQQSIRFYREVVGLPLALEVPQRRAAFFWIGRDRRSMLGLWEIGSSPLGLHLHLAFEATLGDVLAAPQRLRAQGVTPLSFAEEETSEPNVLGWMPAAAVTSVTPMRTRSNISLSSRKSPDRASGSFPTPNGLPALPCATDESTPPWRSRGRTDEEETTTRPAMAVTVAQSARQKRATLLRSARWHHQATTSSTRRVWRVP